MSHDGGEGLGKGMHAVHMAEAMIGFWELLMHPQYDMFELLSIFSCFHLFVPIFTHSYALVWPLELGFISTKNGGLPPLPPSHEFPKVSTP